MHICTQACAYVNTCMCSVKVCRRAHHVARRQFSPLHSRSLLLSVGAGVDPMWPSCGASKEPQHSYLLMQMTSSVPIDGNTAASLCPLSKRCLSRPLNSKGVRALVLISVSIDEKIEQVIEQQAFVPSKRCLSRPLNHRQQAWPSLTSLPMLEAKVQRDRVSLLPCQNQGVFLTLFQAWQIHIEPDISKVET